MLQRFLIPTLCYPSAKPTRRIFISEAWLDFVLISESFRASKAFLIQCFPFALSRGATNQQVLLSLFDPSARFSTAFEG